MVSSTASLPAMSNEWDLIDIFGIVYKITKFKHPKFQKIILLQFDKSKTENYNN